MSRLLPRAIDNNYQGPKISLYFFIIFMIVNTWRSFVHFLAEDAGINSIANIVTFEGNPDPDNLIYLFGSLWGEMQVLLCLISWIVIVKYKAFIPFFYLIWLLEWILRVGVIGKIHPLEPIYQTGITPGQEYAWIVLVLLSLFFMISLFKVKTK